MRSTSIVTALFALVSAEVPEKISQNVFYRSEKHLGSNTCSFAFDGDCDDGGAGSDFSVCEPNTDSHDCGDNSCVHKSDGDCDDGGPGSDYSLCDLGTDSDDCDRRSGQCSNSCSSPADNECDDGGSGSLFNLCPLGSDCDDCGARETSYLRAEAAAIEQKQFPALRDQKMAKTKSQQGNVMGLIGGVGAIGVLVAAGVLVHRRRAAQTEPAFVVANDAGVVLGNPTMM
jgi:hypothetical protein